jgi:NTP pyrophosphatase (non-canonical NTP hydrolase)
MTDLPDFSSLQTRCETISEAYAACNGFTRDDAWFMLKLQEEIGEVTQAFVKASGRGRTHGKSQSELKQDLTDEVADLFGHLLLFCQHSDIDLAKAMEEKWLVHEAPS